MPKRHEGPHCDSPWPHDAFLGSLSLVKGWSEVDELYKICSVIGTPNQNSWSEGLNLANELKYQFPQFARVHLSLLIPSASDDAINLISSLCSWDPYKRPSAAEALHHSFFQCCFYIPPSLRPKVFEMPKTPPSVGISGALEQQKTARRSSVESSAKPASNFSSTNVLASLKTGVQRKLEMNYEDRERNEKNVHNNLKQPPYRPPARNNPAPGYMGRNNTRRTWDIPDEKKRSWDIADEKKLAQRTWNVADEKKLTQSMRGSYGKVSDVANKFSQLKVNSVQQNLPRPPLPRGFRGRTDFLGRSHENPYGRSYSRKVAG